MKKEIYAVILKDGLDKSSRKNNRMKWRSPPFFTRRLMNVRKRKSLFKKPNKYKKEIEKSNRYNKKELKKWEISIIYPTRAL